MSDKNKYSHQELKEFEDLILQKLRLAKEELNTLMGSINHSTDETTDGSYGGVKTLEDGAETAEKEQMNQLAARQQKFINNLENALIRIKNGTYGICVDTGMLIQKERLGLASHGYRGRTRYGAIGGRHWRGDQCRLDLDRDHAGRLAIGADPNCCDPALCTQKGQSGP